MTQEFEGQEISEFIASIPSMKLEAPESYQRGTYLTLHVEVRVRSVRYEEVTTGKNKGDLVKVHMLAVENVSVAETITPQQRQAILEAAQKELDEHQAGSVIAEAVDAGSLVEPVAGPVIAEPVAAVIPEPVIADQMTPDTLTVAAETDPTDGDSEWVYESPEGVAPDRVDAGF